MLYEYNVVKDSIYIYGDAVHLKIVEAAYQI